MFRNRFRLMECCIAFKYVIAYHTPNNTYDSSSSPTAAEDHMQQVCSILMGVGLPTPSLVDLYYVCD
jgi:hypothetical protein